jgi:hypothetical protein
MFLVLPRCTGNDRGALSFSMTAGITVGGGVGSAHRGAPMTGPGDPYRLKALNMLAMASQSERYRDEFENLAMAFMRLAEQADHNAQMNLPFAPDEATVHQRRQPEETPQRQQPQPKDKVKE